jgi:hypothetical protein
MELDWRAAVFLLALIYGAIGALVRALFRGKQRARANVRLPASAPGRAGAAASMT